MTFAIPPILPKRRNYECFCLLEPHDVGFGPDPVQRVVCGRDAGVRTDGQPGRGIHQGIRSTTNIKQMKIGSLIFITNIFMFNDIL